MIEELTGLLQPDFDVETTELGFKIGSLEIIEIDDTSIVIDGYSDYLKLPKKFVFEDVSSAIGVVYPFILQALDGETRI